MDEYVDLDGCRKRWCAVIGVAIQDIRSRDIMGVLQAANWLRGENYNLRNICEHLGLRTDDIRDEALVGYKEPTYRQLAVLRARRTPTTTKLLANKPSKRYDNRNGKDLPTQDMRTHLDATESGAQEMPTVPKPVVAESQAQA